MLATAIQIRVISLSHCSVLALASAPIFDAERRRLAIERLLADYPAADACWR
jgi:hypothetical protein